MKLSKATIQNYVVHCESKNVSSKPRISTNQPFFFNFQGQDYNHQAINPSNQCQWCDLYDATARANSAWSNRPAVPCNDQNACTKQDTCNSGRYERESGTQQFQIKSQGTGRSDTFAIPLVVRETSYPNEQLE